MRGGGAEGRNGLEARGDERPVGVGPVRRDRGGWRHRLNRLRALIRPIPSIVQSAGKLIDSEAKPGSNILLLTNRNPVQPAATHRLVRRRAGQVVPASADRLGWRGGGLSGWRGIRGRAGFGGGQRGGGGPRRAVLTIHAVQSADKIIGADAETGGDGLLLVRRNLL